MYHRLLLIISLSCFCFTGCIPQNNTTMTDTKGNTVRAKKDDWLFEQNKQETDSGFSLGLGLGLGIGLGTRSSVGASIQMQKSLMAAPAPQTESLGFAVGGAKDSNNFRENLNQGFLPKYHAISYEGVFYDYYFNTGIGRGQCNDLFCPSYAKAVAPDLFSQKPNYYLTLGLNSGLTAASFSRKPLNLVVVIDISGSMGGELDSYYYDGSIKKPIEDAEANKTKMQLANETIVAMMHHLRPGDTFGVVLFDDQAYRAKPLRLVENTNMQAIADHIMEIREQGGTNWQAGYEEGVRLYASLEKSRKNMANYENRIIFLTDAMPNTGELRKGGLFDMVSKAADQGIHTSFIGVGIDFNPELVEYVTKTKGANYFSVHNAKEFNKILAEDFNFMVTPLVFDLELAVTSNSYVIDGVFGSPEADLATGKVMQIKTLFPSASENSKVKGGVVLVKLKKTSTASRTSDPITLAVRYKDRNGTQYTTTDTVTFTNNDDGYANNGIRKAILLSDYVSLVKNWLLDQNKSCNDHLSSPPLYPVPLFTRSGLINPENREERLMISTWERRSCPLEVSAGYGKFFTLFRNHFTKESKILGDAQLKEELKVLNQLITAAQQTTGQPYGEGKRDDWEL